MYEQQEYCKGDRVRIVQGSLAAPEGVEGTVVKVCRDADNTITALNILITNDPAHTHGTTVFPREVELISTAITES